MVTLHPHHEEGGTYTTLTTVIGIPPFPSDYLRTWKGILKGI